MLRAEDLGDICERSEREWSRLMSRKIVIEGDAVDGSLVGSDPTWKGVVGGYGTGTAFYGRYCVKTRRCLRGWSFVAG